MQFYFQRQEKIPHEKTTDSELAFPDARPVCVDISTFLPLKINIFQMQHMSSVFNTHTSCSPGLEEILRPVSSVEAEHVALLRVVRRLGGERVVDAHGVVHVVEDARFLRHVLVLVQVQHHVAQHRVEHLPTAFPDRCWKQEALI